MNVIIFILVGFTVISLIVGIVNMGISGGKLNEKYSNKLMTLRVLFQTLAIIAIGIIYWLKK